MVSGSHTWRLALLKTIKMKSIFLILFSTSLILCSCSDNETPELPESSSCGLPYEVLELIGESELSSDIIEENYQIYQNIDSLNGFTLELCDLGKHLIVQIVSNLDEHKFTVYDSCSVHIATGMFIDNAQLEMEFESSIEVELDKNITVLDLAEINFATNVVRYIAEINEDGEEPRYLLESDGEIICKLF